MNKQLVDLKYASNKLNKIYRFLAIDKGNARERLYSVYTELIGLSDFLPSHFNNELKSILSTIKIYPIPDRKSGRFGGKIYFNSHSMKNRTAIKLLERLVVLAEAIQNH